MSVHFAESMLLPPHLLHIVSSALIHMLSVYLTVKTSLSVWHVGVNSGIYVQIEILV